MKIATEPLSLKDNLISCIGMTSTSMMIERRRSGFTQVGKPIACCGGKMRIYSFYKVFPELLYELVLRNTVELNKVIACDIDISDRIENWSQKQETFKADFLQKIEKQIAYEAREWFDSRYGLQANVEFRGYFLPNGELISDELFGTWYIMKMPPEGYEHYITWQEYLTR